MTGTLAGALAARHMAVPKDGLWAEAKGKIENVEGKPFITAIHVRYHLRVAEGKRTEAERAVGIHEKGCPAAQSVKRGIAISWDAEIEETAAPR